MTCGFLELPGNIVQQTDERGAIGVPIGLAYGLDMLVTREVVGVYEFLTAPFPLPSGYGRFSSPSIRGTTSTSAGRLLPASERGEDQRQAGAYSRKGRC
jgi:putative exosortase-associated protein (TIGR04073 family)